ncbi:hypothetical protein H7H37_10850, partial [Mycolicibacterium insubricum]|nr:hypothetical protein [Mycolicibacterium insubricum]
KGTVTGKSFDVPGTTGKMWTLRVADVGADGFQQAQQLLTDAGSRSTKRPAPSPDATERADQLGGDNSKLIAAVARAGPAALTGRIDDARQACAEATEIAVHRGADRVQYAAASSLGLLEVSLGRYPEAIDALSGVIANFRREPWITEIHSAVFVSEAVEALVALDRLDEAESLVAAMETGGARLGRPWTIAEGARGRAMLLVARGDLAGAEAAVRRALAEHDHLEMAFTRARIVLLLGQILRRRRRRQAAAEALAQALWAFEDMGAQIWRSAPGMNWPGWPVRPPWGPGSPRASCGWRSAPRPECPTRRSPWSCSSRPRPSR